MKSHYSELGIQSNASEQEIKKAFKKLAMMWHPDKSEFKMKEPEYSQYSVEELREIMSEKFKKIVDAYGILIDPVAKKAYDIQLNTSAASDSSFTADQNNSRKRESEPDYKFNDFFSNPYFTPSSWQPSKEEFERKAAADWKNQNQHVIRAVKDLGLILSLHKRQNPESFLRKLLFEYQDHLKSIIKKQEKVSASVADINQAFFNFASDYLKQEKQKIDAANSELESHAFLQLCNIRKLPIRSLNQLHDLGILNDNQSFLSIIKIVNGFFPSEKLKEKSPFFVNENYSNQDKLIADTLPKLFSLSAYVVIPVFLDSKNTVVDMFKNFFNADDKFFEKRCHDIDVLCKAVAITCKKPNGLKTSKENNDKIKELIADPDSWEKIVKDHEAQILSQQQAQAERAKENAKQQTLPIINLCDSILANFNNHKYTGKDAKLVITIEKYVRELRLGLIENIKMHNKSERKNIASISPEDALNILKQLSKAKSSILSRPLFVKEFSPLFNHKHDNKLSVNQTPQVPSLRKR